MKILELQLLIFGPFTDVLLEFAGESPGVYIIFGPNEAGKSSALRALTALLFGIDHHSPDNFIHDYYQLRIGGKIRNAAGCELGFLRRKGRSNTLLHCQVFLEAYGGMGWHCISALPLNAT